jgi:hypothetical protein
VDLHEIQRRGVAVATALNSLVPQMNEIAKTLGDSSSSVPANVKAQFESLNKEFESVRKKFGVPLPVPAAGGRGGGGGGGGGRGGPPPDPENVLARATTLKNQVAAVWESPSEAIAKRYKDAKTELPKAITEANAWLGKAAAMSRTLAKYDVALKVPPVVK